MNNSGEQPLPPYGACLLGSLNLVKFVEHPFDKDAAFDFDELGVYAGTAVRFLDNVIDLSNFPLEQQREEAKNKRRMGIGFTGLGDALIMLGIRYGSKEAVAFTEKVAKTIANATYSSSAHIAGEKGSCPVLCPDDNFAAYLNAPFIKALDQDVQNLIAEKGIRNTHLTSIAPTGTISLLAGNISSGIEPVFAYSYTRKIRIGDEKDIKEHDVQDYAYAKYCQVIGKPKSDKDLPKTFVNTDDLTPEEHVAMQAAAQKWIDSSCSKTVNIPGTFPFEDFKAVYKLAYKSGLKGITTFRPSEFITGVLVKKEDKKPEKKVEATRRPSTLSGTTYKVKVPASKDAYYVTINDIDDDGKKRPYEVFINSKNLNHQSWTTAMTRLLSAVFRREPDPAFIVEELASVYDPAGGYFNDGEFVPSLPAEIGRVIEKHLRSLGIMPPKGKKKTIEEKQDAATVASQKELCPTCNKRGVIRLEGCLSCTECGYSKCGG